MIIKYVGINTKYIHTNVAIRILDKITKSKYDTSFIEFSIKEEDFYIFNKLKDCDVILFSCYIWNIEKIKNVSKLLKDFNSNIILVAGGPEVSYDSKEFIKYFDYIMCGEGEDLIKNLLDHINDNKILLNKHIATKFNKTVEPYFSNNLDNNPLVIDSYTKEDIEKRTIYVETNRGCPFKCSYCLSSLENGVRYFNNESTKKILEFIKNNKFKCVKFLDRTFNINPKRFINICKYLEDSPNIYQFEVEPNIFNSDVVNYFTNDAPINKFRLEVGIQTLTNRCLNRVDRKQNNTVLLKNIDKINKKGRVVIHTDLIAGLPLETLGSFKKSFDKIFSLETSELQLGFLKMLRGTKIRKEYKKYNYKFTKSAPYEVISSSTMSKSDLKIIKKVEKSLDWMWNDKRCYHLLKHLLKDKNVPSFFDFFLFIEPYIFSCEQLHDRYKNLIKGLAKLNILKQDYIDDLKLDYLSKNLIKPVPFWIDGKLDKNPIDYKVLGLSKHFKNAFISPYYDGLIIISYFNKARLKIVSFDQIKRSTYLFNQFDKHSNIEIDDIIKFTYQNCFGVEHLINDENKAYKYLIEEFNNIKPSKEELFEKISNNYYRVNLKAYKYNKLDINILFKYFIKSNNKPKKTINAFKKDLSNNLIIYSLYKDITDEELFYINKYLNCIGPISHSLNYKAKNDPHYRLIHKDYINKLKSLIN